MTGMPSLDLLADRVRSERERQLRHFEAIDTKSMVEEGSRLLRQKSILLAIGAVLLATGTILLALEALVR